MKDNNGNSYTHFLDSWMFHVGVVMDRLQTGEADVIFCCVFSRVRAELSMNVDSDEVLLLSKAQI